MRLHDLELGMAFEDAAQNQLQGGKTLMYHQTRHGDHGVVLDGLAPRRHARMQDDRNAQLGDAPIQRIQRHVVHLDAHNVRIEHHSSVAEGADGAFQLRQRIRCTLPRQAGQADEAVWVLCHGHGQSVVASAGGGDR